VISHHNITKRINLHTNTQQDINLVATELNDRPRHTLSWMSPSEALDAATR